MSQTTNNHIYAFESFRNEVENLLKDNKIPITNLEKPPENIDADLAMPVFALAKEYKKAPAAIAEELKNKLIIPKKSMIKEIKSQGPYLNFFKDNETYTKKVLENIEKQKDKYGQKPKKTEKVMIEYSQANTHKAFHVGHIRGTSLGESLARIMKTEGFDVIQANYQGDTGAHVAKWLWCYLKFHSEEKPPKDDPEKWIASIYVEAVKKIKDNPDLQTEVDKINANLENKTDKDLVKLWEKSRKWSLDALEKIYEDLDAHFDHYFFEGQMEDRAKEASYDLVKKEIAIKDNGAVIMDLKSPEKGNLGIWVLLRKDGTCLYSSKDIALAEIKFNKYKIDKSVYIVGAAQSLHMQQLFKTLDLMGFENAKKCHHLSFAEVRLPTGKMSSRTGDNILYADMVKELKDYAEDEVKKRHPEWKEKDIEKSAKNISIAAMKFGMLNQSPTKLIVFDPKEALNFEGDTGPYLQYTHARADSILRKEKPKGKFNPALLKEKEELDLIKKLSFYPETVTKAAETYEPNVISAYALDLAHCFNTFYHTHQVIKAEDEEIKTARLALVDASRQVLKNCLTLLAIEAPDQM